MHFKYFFKLFKAAPNHDFVIRCVSGFLGENFELVLCNTKIKCKSAMQKGLFLVLILISDKIITKTHFKIERVK
jgi:hypothetical protein